MKYDIDILRGEGVGPEVIAATTGVLDAVTAAFGLQFELQYGPEVDPVAPDDGLASALVPGVCEFFEAAFAAGRPVLCGPAGGRFVYDLRRKYDLFYKLVPLRPVADCSDLGPIVSSHTAGADVLIVRENMSGLYFGEWGRTRVEGDELAFHRFEYRRSEIERVVRVAARHAEDRRGSLCMVVKTGGIPGISSLWRDVLASETAGSGLETSVLEIDNAVYQLINAPREFDVIVTPNMFGDVLADCGALLIGARGMSFSGNFGDAERAVYQTGHGAAHDIAGQDRANPVGQVMSLAMLMRDSLGLDDAAAVIETAVGVVLAGGYRTVDIAAPGGAAVGTAELGERIAAAISEAARVPEAG